ncbi:DUF1294 domain-containing protein [Parasedimentitalea maritima]|uniref:DUF1294 domain-containing protein n=1 Tax=Parasedimentitalea maritima TaxID=2578117 RepID=A0A6A4RML9_9RHOB|nr:DUF1294 domain-containing protein [Zongyanglinia marina]KAE9631068.1 DUF1294 domain-containing protein [Zongyanglinia marina]
MSTNPWVLSALYLFTINALEILLFMLDKRRARLGHWRISERTLLIVALVGGTPSAYWSRRLFRHKTRKQPFSTLLHVIALLQLSAVTAITWNALSGKYF